MTKRIPKQPALTPLFASHFLELHAGQIIENPYVAAVELVANSWDAGASRVEVTWPESAEGGIAVRDNGLGMTEPEFMTRWRTLNYDRRKEQGTRVEFPSASGRRRRTAFGRNGLGRHAMFRFANEYQVRTSKDGTESTFTVRRSSGASPFEIAKLGSRDRADHGTEISCTTDFATLTPTALRDLIGSRFVADPDFVLTVNGHAVELTDLDHLCESQPLEVDGLGTILVRRYDLARSGRTSKQHGIAFWVNKRAVGEARWEIGGVTVHDARHASGKRYTYIIEADILEPHVKADWAGFVGHGDVHAVERTASDHIRKDLRLLEHDFRMDRKREALRRSAPTIRQLPPMAQETVAEFAEELQQRCPRLTSDDLVNAVDLLAGLEKARSGYSLLERLATLEPDQLDELDDVLAQWSVADVKRVMGELGHRLRLISKLEDLVQSGKADELHELHPLFERGLWIFGPQFESLEFRSNQTLATAIRDFLALDADKLQGPSRRPDIIAVPTGKLGVYSRDGYRDHEVDGVGEVFILELKRAAHDVTRKDKTQAQNYAAEVRATGLSDAVPITCLVLGTTIEDRAVKDTTEGVTVVRARRFDDVLRQAHARTFNLLHKLEANEKWQTADRELREVLGTDTLFGGQG